MGEAPPSDLALYVGTAPGDEEAAKRRWWRNAAIGAAIGAGVAAGGTALVLELFGPEVPYSPTAVVGMSAAYGAVAGAVLGLIWTSGRT